MVRYENESAAAVRCGIVVDFTCDEYGTPDDEIVCGQTAEWVNGNGLHACSDCYGALDEIDRSAYRYLDDDAGAQRPTHDPNGEKR